jgi:hypothetical protein
MSDCCTIQVILLSRCVSYSYSEASYTQDLEEIEIEKEIPVGNFRLVDNRSISPCSLLPAPCSLLPATCHLPLLPS